MALKATPLLCELHAHTTGATGLVVRQLCDLYGRRGFDVCRHGPHDARLGHIDAANHAAYLDEIEAQAERARALYGLLVLPGLELTADDRRRAPPRGCDGLRSWSALPSALNPPLAAARARGGACRRPPVYARAGGRLGSRPPRSRATGRAGAARHRRSSFNRDTLLLGPRRPAGGRERRLPRPPTWDAAPVCQGGGGRQLVPAPRRRRTRAADDEASAWRLTDRRSSIHFHRHASQRCYCFARRWRRRRSPTKRCSRPQACSRALGDRARVRIVSPRDPRREPLCCGRGQVLRAAFRRLESALVSHHLKKLTEAGLLDREQRGKCAYFTP
jgi:hypothetical protein